MATADPKFTRCPGCKTVFRVTGEQLALRGGQVRCGHCRTVFDANAQALSVAPRSRAEADLDDDFVRGPATVTLRDSRALEAAPSPAAAATPPAHREPVFAPLPATESADAAEAVVGADADARTPASLEDAAGTAGTADVDASAPAEGPAEPEAALPAGAGTARPARSRTALYGAAIPLLVVLFVAQAVLHFRDAIAARWPGTKPTLVRVCDTLGCTIRPLHDIAGLSIDASDLQADPAHKGLLVLTATVRNRAAVPLAFPMLELTLTDASDTVVLRRALNPGEYAGGTANLGAGIQPNSEVLVKMFIDASATSQAGYRLYLFYP